MTLGAFSMSLSVKDIHASKEFYEHLGFSVFAGDIEKKYLIMKNGNTSVLCLGFPICVVLEFGNGKDRAPNKYPRDLD